MNSYLTLDEASKFFHNANEYNTDQQQLALDASYSLVNSFLSSNIPLPAITSDGKIPGILKLQQAKFFQYVLEFSNQGQTEELQQLFDKTAEFLAKLTKNELLISEVQTTAIEIGWNIQDTTLTKGEIFVKGVPPEDKTTFRFVCSTAGYTASAKFNIYRSDSDQVYGTITGSYDWQVVGISNLYIRFDGQFDFDEEFVITGIPYTQKKASAKAQFQQSEIIY